MSKAYQAYATGGFRFTGHTPRAAAVLFFEKFPTKRKCDIIEGEQSADRLLFTITYGRASLGNWPKSWKGVTKKTAHDLPNEA